MPAPRSRTSNSSKYAVSSRGFVESNFGAEAWFLAGMATICWLLCPGVAIVLVIVGSSAGDIGDNCLVGNVAGVSAADGSVDGTCETGIEDPMDFTGDDCVIASSGLNVERSGSKIKDCALIGSEIKASAANFACLTVVALRRVTGPESSGELLEEDIVVVDWVGDDGGVAKASLVVADALRACREDVVPHFYSEVPSRWAPK